MTGEETIRRFWEIQDSGDYTQLVPLFAEDAVVVDPIYGTFRGREAIGGFMAKMVEEMGAQQTSFTVEEIGGADAPDGRGVVWAQWIADTPRGKIQGCGLYRTYGGQLTYYRDYMNAAAETEGG